MRDMSQSCENTGAIGLRAKTGKAIAVLLAGPSQAPRPMWRNEIRLASPSLRASYQPYHAVMDLPWADAVTAARATESVIEDVASEALRGIVREAHASGIHVASAGIVGFLDRDLARIGNPHIRAHAAEGILFRRVLEVAALRNGLFSATFCDDGLETLAESKLDLTVAALRSRLDEFGRVVGRPWRADEKLAAIAAWLTLGFR
jgi:hypothetical protein